MVMDRIKKFLGKEEEEEEIETEAETEAETEVEEEPPTEAKKEAEVEEEALEEPPTRGKGTIPYHDTFQKRLEFLFDNEETAGDMKAPDEFSLEFMVMGERFNVTKDSMGPVEIESGTTSDEDVFIRISNTVAKNLLDAATFDEFSDTYMQYYRESESDKYVKIDLRKPIEELNKRGYVRVPILRLLVGQVRP
ncbi:MAG: hypothetical protein GF309_14395 [Candidatus Lokiarchaeota archaeon]|nr:hypothetical protein [Candidatus Lokiarchaeota archaeon]